MSTRRYLITGRVQGVGFRWSTLQLARDLHVTGTVQNLPTGQVAVVATATAAVLEKFQHRLRHVSPWGRVTRIDLDDLPARHFADFRIIN